jgi:hypothetical protein
MADDRRCRPMRHVAIRRRNRVEQRVRKVPEPRAEHDRGLRQRTAAAPNRGGRLFDALVHAEVLLRHRSDVAEITGWTLNTETRSRGDARRRCPARLRVNHVNCTLPVAAHRAYAGPNGPAPPATLRASPSLRASVLIPPSSPYPPPRVLRYLSFEYGTPSAPGARE